MIIKVKPQRIEDPKEEGKYLFWSPTFGISLVRVFYKPEQIDHGFVWEGYFAVNEWGGKDVSRHSNDCFFVAKIEVE